MQTGLGAPVRRVEDERMLTGAGHYVDDLALPNMAFAHVVRSPHAHARILRIDTGPAASAPGVLAILTGEDIAREKLAGLVCQGVPRPSPGNRSYSPEQPLLARGKVRHVGEAVALIVAETAARARDAADLVAVEYEVLPAVTVADALAPDAPKVWDDADGNMVFRVETGDGGAVDRQFAAAAHIATVSVAYPRTTANSLEGRAAVAYRDAMDGRFTLCVSAQAPHEVKRTVSRILGIPQPDLRVVAMDVGGAFGMKGHVYPEEILVVWAAGKVGRPVKWTADRSEGLAADTHGRGPRAEAALAFDRDGKILAFRASVVVEVGGYLSRGGATPPNNAAVSYPGPYHVPLIQTSVRAVFTNTSPLGPYRGSGKPEATFVLERLMEAAARDMGIDAVELRRRNLIPASAMPYKSAGGYVYDSGNFELVLDRGLALADRPGFEQRRAASERRGLRRGMGIALHCQRAGNQSERMEIRVGPDGRVALHVGTLSTGQSHETMFAQMVSDWLCLPMDRIRVFQGDTDKALFGRGTFAQRSMGTGGSALKLAADAVIDKGRRLSAWMLEASEADIAFEDGYFRVAGTDRQVGFAEVAAMSYQGAGLPGEFGVGLDGVGNQEGSFTFPNGCMICEVEVDPETGTVVVDRLYAVDDVGVVVNPLTLDGQLHGSVAQGLGEALVEQVVYERGTGQLLTGSFMDYAMPRADMMPDIVSEVCLVPAGTNLLGTKGGAEAGNCGAPPALIHAVIDALSPWGVTDIPLPATPERVWRALHAG